MSNLYYLLGFIFFVCLVAAFLFWKRYNKNIHEKYDKLIKKIEYENNPSNDFSSETSTVIEKEKVIEPISLVENIQEEITQTLEVLVDIKNNDFKNKPMTIADETLNSILHKLKRFEKSKSYIKNEVSFTYLATFTGTNTKYLSEILKQHRVNLILTTSMA